SGSWSASVRGSDSSIAVPSTSAMPPSTGRRRVVARLSITTPPRGGSTRQLPSSTSSTSPRVTWQLSPPTCHAACMGAGAADSGVASSGSPPRANTASTSAAPAAKLIMGIHGRRRAGSSACKSSASRRRAMRCTAPGRRRSSWCPRSSSRSSSTKERRSLIAHLPSELPAGLADGGLGALDELADVALGEPEDLADLGLLLAVEAIHAERDALLGGQRGQHLVDPPQVAALGRLRLGILGHLRRAPEQPAHGGGVGDGLAAQPAQAAVGGHAVEPALERLVVVEPPDHLAQRDEHVLGDVLGPGAIAPAVAQGEAVDLIAVLPIEPSHPHRGGTGALVGAFAQQQQGARLELVDLAGLAHRALHP